MIEETFFRILLAFMNESEFKKRIRNSQSNSTCSGFNTDKVIFFKKLLPCVMTISYEAASEAHSEITPSITCSPPGLVSVAYLEYDTDART